MNDIKKMHMMLSKHLDLVILALIDHNWWSKIVIYRNVR